MLPMGPTGYGSSPYQVFGFAGNPLLIQVPRKGDFPAHTVDFGGHSPKQGCWQAAEASLPTTATRLRRGTGLVVEDYAVHALKRAHGGVAAEWDPGPLARSDRTGGLELDSRTRSSTIGGSSGSFSRSSSLSSRPRATAASS
jgi:hypothetical protein